MEIGYTAEQEALRHELSTYFERLLDDDTVEELSHGHGIGEATKRVWKQMCTDGWAGIGWPKEYGGQERGPIDQFIFFDESMRAGAPVPMLDAQHRRPDDHELRHRVAEGVLPAEDPRRATCTSASATPSRRPAPTSPRLQHPGGARRRRVRHQRAEDVDQRWPAAPTTAGSPCAPIPTPRSTRASR